MSKEFENLLAQYWDLAYLEGKSSISQGDKANEVLHALKKLAEQPAQQQTDERIDALRTLDYCHGLKAGWNFCAADDDAGFERAMAGTSEAVRILKTQPAQQQEPVAWMPIEQMYPQAKAIDILMGDGSILCAVLPQFDGDLWWEGSGTGEKFIDPKYANVTHWRIHDERTSPPAQRKIPQNCGTGYCSCIECLKEPAQPQQEPLTDSQIMASIGRHWGGEKTSISQSRPVGQQWEQICELVRCVIRERYTSPPTLSLAQRQARSADTWVGLTANEVEEIFQKKLGYYPTIYAVEAKLKAKNSP